MLGRPTLDRRDVARRLAANAAVLRSRADALSGLDALRCSGQAASAMIARTHRLAHALTVTALACTTASQELLNEVGGHQEDADDASP